MSAARKLNFAPAIGADSRVNKTGPKRNRPEVGDRVGHWTILAHGRYGFDLARCDGCGGLHEARFDQAVSGRVECDIYVARCPHCGKRSSGEIRIVARAKYLT